MAEEKFNVRNINALILETMGFARNDSPAQDDVAVMLTENQLPDELADR
jgi:hypothetical protein